MNKLLLNLMITLSILPCYAMEQQGQEEKKEEATEFDLFEVIKRAHYAKIDAMFQIEANRKLHRAIIDNNIEEIKTAIQEGAHPNTDYNNVFPLYFAIEQYALALRAHDAQKAEKYLDLVKFLVTHGASPYLGKPLVPYDLVQRLEDKFEKFF